METNKVAYGQSAPAITPYNILVGGGMKRMFKDVYMTAKKSGRIHQSL